MKLEIQKVLESIDGNTAARWRWILRAMGGPEGSVFLDALDADVARRWASADELDALRADFAAVSAELAAARAELAAARAELAARGPSPV